MKTLLDTMVKSIGGVFYFMATLFLFVSMAGATTLYVSPSGSDSNDGTSLAAPFKTIERARQAVKIINRAMSADIVVELRGGTYQLTSTQIFDEGDGGTNGYWVIYKNHENERPVFSGGVRMDSGWTPVSGYPGFYEKSVKEIGDSTWWFRSMYADGQRLIDNNVDQSQHGDGRSTNCDAFSVNTWIYSRLGPFYNGLFDSVFRSIGGYVINRSSGKIWLKSDTDPNSREIWAPKLEILFDIRGTSDARINNIRFAGIAFEHTLWPFPNGSDIERARKGDYNGCYNERAWGNYCNSAGYGPDNEHDSIEGDVRQISNMVTVEYARHAEFVNCKFRFTENNGLGFGRGTDQCRISYCEFFENGAKGLWIGWRGRVTADGWVKNDWACGKGAPNTPPNTPGYDINKGDKGDLNVLGLWNGIETDIPGAFEVSDSVFHNSGRIYRGNPALHVEAVRKCAVIYNEIYETYYNGIIFQNFQMPKADAEIRFNEIHRCNMDLRMTDGQPLYVSNNDHGIMITNNVLWDNGDIVQNGNRNSGIYLDQFGSEATVQYNVLQSSHPDKINVSSGHTITNNIRGASQSQIDAARAIAGPRQQQTTGADR